MAGKTSERSLGDSVKDPLAKEAFIGGGKKKTGPEKIDSDRVRATYYLTRDHIMILDRIRLKRLEAGANPGEVDKSRLIREAVELLAKQENI